MRPSRRLLVAGGLAVAAAAVAAVALALPSGGGGPQTTTVVGAGMMNGSGAMMGGYGFPQGPAPTPAASLPSVRTRVESWLRSRGFAGFQVSEVMAFANNDYVAVKDAKGTPAFELLTTPNLSWLMEEPPSMMWNRRYGMMRGFGRNWSGMGPMMGGAMMGGWNGWYGRGEGKVHSLDAAVKLADRWLARSRSGELVDPDVDGMGRFPGYYTLDTTRNGKTLGMLSVNARTGAVWYHGWHGRFLGEARVLTISRLFAQRCQPHQASSAASSGRMRTLPRGGAGLSRTSARSAPATPTVTRSKGAAGVRERSP